MRILVTGADGFIGRNLRLKLAQRKDVEVRCFGVEHDPGQLRSMLDGVDFVFHLAGVNRPRDPGEFFSGNRDLTHALCGAVGDVATSTGRKASILLTSSIHADSDHPYGQSKRAAEGAVFAAARAYGVRAQVFRLPNVFGKWCRPNYNSAVATFCYNIARGLPIQVQDPARPLTLVHIDDVVDCFAGVLDGTEPLVDADGFATVTPQYATTVGEVAEMIRAFKEGRESLVTPRAGTGLTRALYGTYLSYLPTGGFTYPIPKHEDARGAFVEMLKTQDNGQVSYFTAHPGVTRGGHYHNCKTEKFLVIKGEARFRFRHMYTGEVHEFITNGNEAEVVETPPGWTHDITNIGPDEMIVMLWANEVFDRARPDTYACPL